MRSQQRATRVNAHSRSQSNPIHNNQVSFQESNIKKQMLAVAPSITATEAAPDLICSVCLDTWKNPLEVKPCGHIFCADCLAQVQCCPECRGALERVQPPNRVLCRMASQVAVRCDGCQWTGTREQSSLHRCFAAPVHPPASSNVKPLAVHNIDNEVVEQLGAYFLAFGGCASPSTDTSDDVTLSKSGFLALVRCFNYAEAQADMEKVFEAVQAMSGDRVHHQDDSVSVHGLCRFLSKYPADAKRLYKLSLGQYHTCMYALYLWFEAAGSERILPSRRREDQKFTPSEFVEFAVKHKFLPKPESSHDAAGLAAHWVALADVCDHDGLVSRHEMLRFMSSCLRGSSLRADNLDEGLSAAGKPDMVASLRQRKETQGCCSMQ